MNHNQKIGKLGEDLACKYLQEKGYEILDRNIKTSFKEIDIVARIKEKIVFIEVKTRTNLKFGGADEAINHKKLKKIITFTDFVHIFFHNHQPCYPQYAHLL